MSSILQVVFLRGCSFSAFNFLILCQALWEGVRAESWRVLSTSEVFLLDWQLLVLLSMCSSFLLLHLLSAMLCTLLLLPRGRKRSFYIRHLEYVFQISTEEYRICFLQLSYIYNLCLYWYVMTSRNVLNVCFLFLCRLCYNVSLIGMNSLKNRVCLTVHSDIHPLLFYEYII